MSFYLNLGNASFENIRNGEYVDKTEIISELNSVMNTKDKLVCVSRPRRFGKSFLAKTLLAYYDRSCDSKTLFSDLKIAQDSDFEKKLNKYPVIYLDITWFASICDDIKNILNLMEKAVIEELKEEFPNAKGNNLPTMIADAAIKYKTKFIIIIDEWDAIFREAKNDSKLQKDYVSLLRGLFKTPLTDSMFTLAYMTGILPIKKYGTQSALTDFREYTMINPSMFAKYVGFTETEVQNLCRKYNVDFSLMKKWYDGYSFDNEKSVYSPNSVIEAVRNNKFDSYWTQTETYESLKMYIDMDFEGIKQDLIFMIGGGECKVDTNSFQNDMVSINSKDDVFTLLIHLGYLAFNSEKSTVYIPNEEIRKEFVTALKNGSRKEIAKIIKTSDELIEHTLSQNEEEVAKAIENVHDTGTSPTFYNNEQSLRSVIRFAYISAIDEYAQIQELPSGKGFADIVFIPKNSSDKPAMIIELKWNKSSEGALNQIKNKNYPQLVKNFGKKEILLVGINYDEKSKKHECRIERINL